MRLPEFITFTGADDRTDIARMESLGQRYPIEWGILFSPKKQGFDLRYPGGEALTRLWWANIRRAAHLRGEHGRRVVAGVGTDLPVDVHWCDRVQVNHRRPIAEPIAKFVKEWDVKRGIVQCRDNVFPRDGSVDWLFDQSGGRGIRPDRWPDHPGGGRLVGYAGGISPDNIASVMSVLCQAQGPYWIDMEGGVRTDDWFDLNKVESVCVAVYGER